MSSQDPDFIDHYREAETTLEVVEFANGAQTSPSYTEYALAEATLALAYEQHTANLLAVFAQLGDGDVSTYLGDAVGNGKKLAEQIIGRLELA